MANDHRRVLRPGDDMTTWNLPQVDGDILVIPGGQRWRIERTTTVGDLVQVGDVVETNYGTAGLVIRVVERTTCCCPLRNISASKLCMDSWELPVATHAYHRQVTYWVITYVHKGAKQTKDGRFYDEDHFCYLGELVAVGNRILKLVEANPDEVFVASGHKQFGILAQLPLL